MATKKSSLLLTLLLLIVLSVRLHAQDKYEYAVLDYTPSYKLIEISINGKDYKKLKVEKSEIQGDSDVNAALKEIEKMSSEGWEVFSASTGNNGSTLSLKSFTFFLRRKIK